MHDWHPLNQSLYAAYKIMLPGMLLAAKGDRALKNASMEGRYPFLDERVVDFCCRLPPRFKLRGFTDKWLLRQLARKALPKQISNRPKTMFRAHLATTFLSESRPPWVDDLLSEESLLCSGFFDPVAVARAVRLQQRLPRRSLRRLIIEMGLTAVVSTQLWYHEFFGGRLCALPNWEAPRLKKDLKTPAVDLAMER